MVDSGSHSVPLLKDHYEDTINRIMERHGVSYWERRGGRHLISVNTRFEEAIQHTEAFLNRRRNTNPHYRYNYYANTLKQYVQLDTRRIAHIDIGCGAGLFSWVFLDWATSKGFDYDRIDLYGLDHSPAMIDIAAMIRRELMGITNMLNYPSLHYDYDTDSFLRRLQTGLASKYTIRRHFRSRFSASL